MNRQVGRVTPCVPVWVLANAARRGLARPTTAGSWSRFAFKSLEVFPTEEP